MRYASPARVAAVLLPLLVALASPAAAETKLLMFMEKWCEWCERWEEEIGVVYDKTTEGKRAPLERISIHDEVPEGIELDRRARFTPTFVLLDDGREVGRIEGYPGEDFFYPMLNVLFERLPEQTEPDKPQEDTDA